MKITWYAQLKFFGQNVSWYLHLLSCEPVDYYWSPNIIHDCIFKTIIIITEKSYNFYRLGTTNGTF